MRHLSDLMWIISLNITDLKQANMVAGDEKQNQPEAEEQNMETSSAADDRQGDKEKEDREKRKEAKVCLLITEPTQ